MPQGEEAESIVIIIILCGAYQDLSHTCDTCNLKTASH